MSGGPLTFTLPLVAPPARVFAALTEARHLARWFCDESESDPREGGAIVMRWTRPGASAQPFVARWVEWAPPALASFEGGHSGYPGGTAGLVRFEVGAAGDGGTLLRVTHELPEGDEHASFADSWSNAWPRALARLERYFAPGAGA